MGFSPAFLEELRRRTILSELISRRGVNLVRRGREFAELCPFHSEKTPSFYVVDAKRFFLLLWLRRARRRDRLHQARRQLRFQRGDQQARWRPCAAV
jgi:hypothetical protein